ncbi:MAG: c-type cytochrome [Gammaproteobacteria bacterium]
MSDTEDRVFFKNFSIVVIVLAVMMVVFILMARVVGGAVEYGDDEIRAAIISERTAPAGAVRIEGDPEPAAETEEMPEETMVAAADDVEGADAGRSVYEGLCISCHNGAIPGIPKIGDAEAWAPRIEQGMDTLYKHAIEGYIGTSGMPMPAKGGDPNLSDDQVKAAVDYMVAESQ